MESSPKQPPKPRVPIKRPGVARPVPGKRKPRKPNWIYIAGCVILMGVFFMPWFSTGVGSVLGYEIPYWTPRILVAYYAPPGIILASNSLWAFAFVGLFAFFGRGMELAGLPKHKNQWWLRLLTALSPVFALATIVSIFTLAGGDELLRLGGQLHRAGVTEDVALGVGGILLALLLSSSWGIWLMGIAMILCAISVPVHPARKRKLPEPPPQDPPPVP